MRVKFLASLVLVIFCRPITAALADEIFRWLDEKGTIHFADSPRSLADRSRGESSRGQLSSRDATLPASAPKSESGRVTYPREFIISLTREDGRLLVDGSINNQSSVRFIIDTGASITIIPARVASQLGLEPKRAPLIEVSGVGGRIDGRLLEIASLRIGNAEARNFDVVVIEDGLLGMGLLGADFLSRFQLDISYTRELMVLHQSEGLYDGYPAAWWQEKFRVYRRLKQIYEQRIKQNEDHLRTLGINPAQRNWAVAATGKVNPLRPIADEITEYENYLKVLEKKISDLRVRAGRAALPRHLWE